MLSFVKYGNGRAIRTGEFSVRKIIQMIRTLVTVALILISIVLTAIVLMQEGKSQGLGAIAGAADTYWGKNKGRSMEGRLVKATTILCVVFFVVCLLLNMQLF
ncbi:preprotein translocase subunit SecG [Lachnospiraceae bacterium NK3A20]|jgi:preprotein translocase subunit SecG|nr:preprotein translocase subunit SecG [Lachnospiraceae bacterium NK3A20]